MVEGGGEAHGAQRGLILTARGNPQVTIDGQPIAFATRHAAQALFALALAPGNALGADELASRLWPDAPESRYGPRLATMLWQLRRGLGSHSWRVARRGTLVALDLDGAHLDAADGHPGDEAPLLEPWAEEPWVRALRARSGGSGGEHEATPGDDRPDRLDHTEGPGA